jgi:hypothetical protein
MKNNIIVKKIQEYYAKYENKLKPQLKYIFLWFTASDYPIGIFKLFFDIFTMGMVLDCVKSLQW